jgi:hypothetical protein
MHWVVELIANLIISVAIAFGSHRLRTQISRKQDLIKMVYSEDSGGFSNLMQIRMMQLRNFGIFYLILAMSMLVLTFVIMGGFASDNQPFDCFNECAIAQTNIGAVIMFLKLNYEQVQVYGLLYFFWWLPRQFNQATIKVMATDGMGGDLKLRESTVFLDPFSSSR